MPEVKLYKMSGAGNDFVVLDGRGVDAGAFRQPERISSLCEEYRTDGLMILGSGSHTDFSMEFYNPDGSGGMMCGNGGRCIVAFADWLGIKASVPDRYCFLAPDGIHSAEILSRPKNYRETGPDSSTQWTIRLKMIDVKGISEMMGGYFLNSGTRHFVKFVGSVDAVDVEKEGKALRWNGAFAPEGANVNFVEVCPDGLLKVRTFEKGVEGETLACGTGLTASALAAYRRRSFAAGGSFAAFGMTERETGMTDRVTIRLQARRGDYLQVDFVPGEDGSFRDIHLTGPAEFC